MTMDVVRVEVDANEPIQVYATDGGRIGLTGLTDLFIRIYRTSDGQYYDFADDTFKAAGWTTQDQVLTEVDATNFPGLYEWTGGFDLSAITNKTADDSYLIRPFQTPGTNAVLGNPAEIKEGQWVATIAAIETDTQDIQSRLPAALVGGRMDSDVGNMQNDTITAAVIATDAIDADAIAANAIGAAEIADGAIDAATFAAGAIDAAAIATDAIDADAIAADAIGASELATSAVNEIRDAIISDATPFQGADIAAILADTADMQPKLGTPVTDISADIAAVQADTDDIQTRLPAALVGGRMDSNVGSFDANVIDAAALATDAVNEIRDSILSDSTPFQGADVAAILADTADMQPKLGTPVTDVSADIAAVQADTNDIQTRLPAALVGGRMDSDVGNMQTDTVDAAALATDAVDEIVDGVWDEPIAGHLTAGSTGAKLNNADATADPSAVADAVWDELRAGHTAVGSFGESIRLAAAGLETDAVNEVRDAILSDSTPFQGADIAAILADTADMQPKLGTPVADVSADIAAIKAETADILADTSAMDARLPSDPADESLQQASHTATQAAIAALNDIDQSDVQAALTAQGYTGARATNLDNLDAAMSTRSSHSAADAADAVWTETLADHSGGAGSTAEALANAESGSDPSAIADAVWDEPIADHQGVGSTGEALTDAGATTNPSVIADAVWDEAVASHVAGGSFGLVLQNKADPGDAMDLTTNAVDSAALDASAVGDIADGVWDEPLVGHMTAGTTGRNQNRLDDDITSRAAPGDAMDLVTGAVDADAIASSGAQEIADSVWDEPLAGHVGAGSTGEAQNRLDADITTRAAPGDQMAITAGARNTLVDAVWDEPIAGHTGAGTTGEALDDASAAAGITASAVADAVWDEDLAAHTAAGSAGEAQGRLDTTISSRAAPGAAMDLVVGAVDSNALAVSAVNDIADGIWDEDITTHVAANSAGLELQNKAEAGDAMDLVTDAVDATSLADAARDKIVDQVWTEQLSDHSGVVGSTAEALDNVAAPASPAVIADAVWDEALAGHVAAGSAGEAMGRVDVAVSTRAAPGDDMGLTANAVDASALATSGVNEIRDSILSDSTPFAGANIDAAISTRADQTTVNDILADTAAIDARLPTDPADESNQNAQHAATQAAIAGLNDLDATAIANAVWDEPTAGHQTAGTTGKALTDAGATADPSAIADAVWDESLAAHTIAGSAGEAQQAAADGAADIAKIDSAPTVGAGAAVSGSLLDLLANKDGSKTYDQATDSLEATRDRIG